MADVNVVGSGAWGTTIALLLAGRKHNVRLICRREEVAKSILRSRENTAHLPGVKLPKSVGIEVLHDASFSGSENIVLAVTSQHMREVLKNPAFSSISRDARILHATKGLEHYYGGKMSGRRMSQVIAEELGLSGANAKRISVLAGPNIATEVAAGKYAETVIASGDSAVSEAWQGIFSVPGRFVPFVSDDVAGVELGGALKNIVAIACGMVDGLGLGENTKAAVIRRGLSEIIAIGTHYGARRETFYGLACLYDLDTTCHSRFSRNRMAGERVAQGKPIGTVLRELIAEKRGEPEGPEMARVVFELNGHLQLPVLKMVYDALFSKRSASSCVRELLGS
ncbi:NAD(P)-dependent glycerol-3-phosphate dehydrogenase [Candidatus Woesearchaeota archaeon]|nr:NAD(P)-dependent glycerol-3-phosphate dehydrogenase [Candidatus Woesearchaeota archaeon]